MKISSSSSLQYHAKACLIERNIESKISLSLATYEAWRAGQLAVDYSNPVDFLCSAGVPDKPELVEFNQLPKRRVVNREGHAALMHSFAHIEFNAINIAWDAVYRFKNMPTEFYEDWSRIAAEEARHFTLIQNYLLELGYSYGHFVAHAGLWEMVEKTSDDVLLRMALVPRVLEAKGLDVTPDIIARFAHHGFHQAADIMQVIYQEEIGHVKAGSDWFNWVCHERGLNPESTFEKIISENAVDRLRKPYNLKAREEAGFSSKEMEFLNTCSI